MTSGTSGAAHAVAKEEMSPAARRRMGAAMGGKPGDDATFFKFEVDEDTLVGTRERCSPHPIIIHRVVGPLGLFAYCVTPTPAPVSCV